MIAVMFSQWSSMDDAVFSLATMVVYFAGQLPSLIVFILPISWFIAIHLHHQQIRSRNELVAYLMVGMTPQRWLRVLMTCATMIVLVQGVISMHVDPVATKMAEAKVNDQLAQIFIDALQPKRFIKLGPQQWLYFQSMDHLQLEQVMMRTPDQAVITASHASLQRITSDHLEIVLTDGNRYQQDPHMTRVHFAQLSQAIEIPSMETHLDTSIEKLSLKQLWQSPQVEAQRLWHWRCTLMVSVWTLTLLAWSGLSFDMRRALPTSALLSFCAMVILIMSMILTKSWVEKSGMAPGMLYLPHLLMWVMLILAYMKQGRHQ